MVSFLEHYYEQTKSDEIGALLGSLQLLDDGITADYVKPYTIFNIGGNNFRLIAEISYLEKTIIIDSIFTHAEYDKEMWKK